MLADYEGFFSRASLGQFGFRWLHILAGITWIGLLYYFNFVQVPAFAKFEEEPHKEIGGKARTIALDKVARKALWWFRWAALFTFLSGILITIVTKDYFKYNFGKSGRGLAISTGMLLGIIMLVNVWAVIWRAQKVVLANAANVLAGGQPDPNVPAAARKALMASRANTIFSVTMLYFMIYTSHGPYAGSGVSTDSALGLGGGKVGAFWAISLIIIVVLELNALGLMPWKTQANKGLNVIYDGPGVRNPLVAAFGLWVVFLVLTEIFFKL